MSNSSSRTYQLIEAHLDKPLAAHVRGLRRAGASWHAVSLDLANRTNVAVTPETVRIWFAGEKGMERGRAGAA